LCSTAGGKEKNGDKRQQQDQRKVTTLSVGQGEPPARVINSYSQFGKIFFRSPQRAHTGHKGHELRNQHSGSLCPSWTLREMICNFCSTYGR
jgi:hypothetical protein